MSHKYQTHITIHPYYTTKQKLKQKNIYKYITYTPDQHANTGHNVDNIYVFNLKKYIIQVVSSKKAGPIHQRTYDIVMVYLNSQPLGGVTTAPTRAPVSLDIFMLQCRVHLVHEQRTFIVRRVSHLGKIPLVSP